MEAESNGLAKSPKILNIKWGEIKIENHSNDIKYNSLIFKDAKCFPGGCKNWDWNETGTRHFPGVQITDIEELLKESKVIVLSLGMDKILKIKQETINYLDNLGIEYYIFPTLEAVEKYNSFVDKNIQVGGLFHSTC